MPRLQCVPWHLLDYNKHMQIFNTQLKRDVSGFCFPCSKVQSPFIPWKFKVLYKACLSSWPQPFSLLFSRHRRRVSDSYKQKLRSGIVNALRQDLRKEIFSEEITTDCFLQAGRVREHYPDTPMMREVTHSLGTCLKPGMVTHTGNPHFGRLRQED